MQTMKPKSLDSADRAAIEAFQAQGKTVTVIPTGKRIFKGKDWKRLTQGLKVASQEEIEAERNRRALKAIRNGDNPLALALMSGQHNHAIKFDIENGRIGPNGEIL